MNQEPIGFSFWETMSGDIALSEPLAPGQVEKTARLTMRATVRIHDLARFLKDPAHEALLMGFIDYSPLGLDITAPTGRFGLLVQDDANPDIKWMIYELGFQVGGVPYYLAGKKRVERDSIFSLWKATTTLYTNLHAGTGTDGPIVGTGILRLTLGGLFALLFSMRALSAKSLVSRAWAALRFLAFFLTELWDTYMWPLKTPSSSLSSSYSSGAGGGGSDTSTSLPPQPPSVAHEHFDAVIVGTGFGGSVMASELAAAGLKVCILERGKKYPPGSFPRTPREIGRNFWDPSLGYYGMFDVWSFKYSEAIVCSGVGGGSLIYANVLIRKPKEWFFETLPDGSTKPWPVTRADLDPHYDEVEKVLGANPYPMAYEPYSSTPKTKEFRRAAEALNAKPKSKGKFDWSLPNLAVTFSSRPGAVPVPGEPVQEPFPNLHNRTRATCRLCGECDIGCNYGSKNTLDYNYLTLAVRAGAILRDSCEVKRFHPAPGGGYEISYVNHLPEEFAGRPRDTKSIPPVIIHADRLILSAGTLGSTYLLLKNRQSFPNISDTLGDRYSTNGDLLTFAFDCKDNSQKQRLIEPSQGPVITSTITRSSGHGGFLIQDAGYPYFLSWLVEASQIPLWIKRILRFVWRRIKQIITREPETEVSEQLADLIGEGRLSSSSMPLLGMGRDMAGGHMSILTSRKGVKYLQVDWNGSASKEYFKEVNEASRTIAREMGGKFVENPATKLLKRILTVHPLGGCPMGRDATEGVVNTWGEVFNYPNLYVADGSVMPGPVGSNPSLTIAALSHRFAQHLLASIPPPAPVPSNTSTTG